MRQLRCSLFVCAWALGLCPPALAQDGDPEQGGAAFLLFPVGGRASALGQAAMADGGSSEAAFWNPAGLALMERGEVAAHHARTFVSDNTALSVYFASPSVGAFGVSAYLVDFGSQEVIPVGGPITTGRFSPKNIELLASYATTITGSFTFGLNYKLIQFRQDCSGDCGIFPSQVGTTHGVDLGLLYGGRSSPFRIGVAIKHAGFRLQVENSDQADPLPTRVALGIAYRVTLPPPTAGAQPLDARLLVDVQHRWRDLGSADARVGMELGYGQLIRLRTGYAFLEGETRGPSVGLGVRFGRVGVDFSKIFFVSSNFDEPVYISIRADL